MNQIRDVVNLDTKAFIMFSDLIKQFYEVKSETLKVLDLKLSHLKILHLLSDHNGINQQEIAVISASALQSQKLYQKWRVKILWCGSATIQTAE